MNEAAAYQRKGVTNDRIFIIWIIFTENKQAQRKHGLPKVKIPLQKIHAVTSNLPQT